MTTTMSQLKVFTAMLLNVIFYWFKYVKIQHLQVIPFFFTPINHIWLVVYLPLLKKYENQLGWLFPTEWKIENVPNHQPVIINH